MPSCLSYPPSKNRITASTRHCLLYFIPGNPGLIDYYEPFLSTLSGLVDNNVSSVDGSDITFHIVGNNLIGFDDADHEPFTEANPPFNLDAQIQASLRHISALRIEAGPRAGAPFDHVVVIGHSVGTYITLELFRHHAERPQVAPHVKFTSAVLLFATITHLAQSRRGQRMRRILSAPLLGANAHRVARAFLDFSPHWALGWIVRRILGFPSHAAAATLRFLRSRGGVWQALHLGRDELQRISEDDWANELWEVADEVEGGAPERDGMAKFYMFFGKEDDWVADEFRDAFIARRKAHGKGRTRIAVDEGDLPHDFCIRKCPSRLSRWEMFDLNGRRLTVARSTPMQLTASQWHRR